MEQTLSLPEIDEMRKGVISLLRTLELKKHLVRSQDRSKLVNHLNYSLETLDNMVNIKRVEMSDPYNSYAAAPGTDYRLDPRSTTRTVVYNRDGTTKIVDRGSINSTGEEWERQFDESQLLKPPCFMMPPQNLSSINRIKSATQDNRVNNLVGSRSSAGHF